jgi:hypothetical protein
MAHLVERVNRNCDERSLTGAVSLDIAQASAPYGSEISISSLSKELRLT